MQRCLEEGVDTDKDGQIDRDEFRGEMLRDAAIC
jgi:Ca2+-binding EF-hand superfamily protein